MCSMLLLSIAARGRRRISGQYRSRSQRVSQTCPLQPERLARSWTRALTPYSNGLVEGHVNRLKFLKRQMYGRAGFKLLHARVLNRC
jgi:transposase